MKTQARIQGSTPLHAMSAYTHLTTSSEIQEDLAHAVCVDVFSIVRFSL